MKNLFLHAKYIASQKKAKEITNEHILETIKTISLGNDIIGKDIVDYLEDQEQGFIDRGTSIVDIELIQKATKLPRIDFNNDVKRFLDAMKEKGYELKGSQIPSKSYTKEKPIIKKNSPGQDMIKAARQIKIKLSQKIFGQDRAIEAVTDSIKNNILENENSPKSTYLFLGPPATGKTYLAELIGENLEDYEIKKFDMTQYHEQNGGELYGYPKGWSGYGVGQLTGLVKNNPKSIIVLDEFEKAANIIQTNLLSIFEGGYMYDACGWDKKTNKPCSDESDSSYDDENAIFKVDFKQTIFIITSNLGKELYSDSKFIDLIDSDYLQAETMILDTLKREEKRDNKSGGTQIALVPELVSRFSQANIVLFNKLTYKAYEAISELAFEQYRNSFNNKFGIKFSKTNNFKNFLKTQILAFAPELDARRIKNKIGVTFFDRVTDHIMSLDEGIDYCKEIKISISKDVTKFIKENINDDLENERLVRELFRKNITLKIDDKFTSKDGVITYKINSCKFKQLQKVKDFSEDGLIFDIPETSFKDIAGHKKAKLRLQEVINFLKNPKSLERFNIQAPKGMLLYGPPGTGKTLLAKAFAKEADLPFIATTGTDLLNSDTIKAIFSKAKEYAPSIVFIDEIDGLGKRGQGNNREIPINKLLSEMDGFSSNPYENVFVIAATNYKDNIDSAIIRPGRIELHISIDDLDKEARQYFLDNIINEKPVSGKFDMSKLLMYTTGMTGAQLELIGKESSIYCLRHGLKSITQEILIEQINTIKYGEKLSHISLEQMIEETAIHEAGHAILSKVLMPHIKIEQITVTPRGSALGFVSYNYEDSQSNMTAKDFKDRICVSMAGRVSQIKKYGNIDGIDTGASNDLQQATRDAYTAISYYGMDEDVGYININGIINAQQKTTGITDTKHYHDKIDKALEKWMNNGEQSTKELVNTHWAKIEQLSKLLLEKEVVYENELNKILGK